MLGLVISLLIVRGGSQKSQHESVDHEDAEHAATVHLTQTAQQALGVAVVPAEIKPLEQTLEVTGQIVQDTERLVHVNPPTAGTLAEVLVTIGQSVQLQQPTAVVVVNQSQQRTEVVAPRAGIILGVHATPGAAVDTLTSLMTIADLSQVSATFDLYEQDVALVRVGQRIEAQSVAYPDRVFSGTVIFVSPQVDQHTRTIKVRAQIDNPDYGLKLGMFVTGILYIPTTEESLVIPHAAVQRIEGQPVVFVQTAPEVFQSREVKIGRETPTDVQILGGLQAGERVVASGSFHLKAELLKGSLEDSHAH